MKTLDLSKNAAAKLSQRPPWLYRNELPQTLYTEPGEVARLVYQGAFLAIAFVNPQSQIAARILTYDDEPIDDDFWRRRIERAIGRRAGLRAMAKRLVHSEADGLPGLVSDLYGKTLVCAITTAGMERIKERIFAIFAELLDIEGIWESDAPVRQKEGLPPASGVRYGEVRERIVIEEGAKRFAIYPKEDQKTGFFLDQRRNRRIVGAYGGRATLDLFANGGGFGIYARAERTLFVEISERACQRIEENCRLNGLENYEIVCQDAFEFLQNHSGRYDLIILDPPAFAKNRKQKSGAMRGWKFLMSQSLDLLEEGGRLAFFSCSHALGLEDLLGLAQTLAASRNLRVEVLETLRQDVDHPWVVTVPASLYLTGAVVECGRW
ncbi:class I SAM-dependent rRNA methyltransferase [Hydrogenimonas sp.]